MEIEQFVDFLVYKSKIRSADIVRALWISFDSEKYKSLGNILVEQNILTREELNRYLMQFKNLKKRNKFKK